MIQYVNKIDFHFSTFFIIIIDKIESTNEKTYEKWYNIYKYRYFHHAVENYLKKTSIINQ